MNKLLIILSLCSFVHAGPLAILMSLAVIGGATAGLAVASVAGGGSRSSNNGDTLMQLVSAAQRCAVSNGELQRENGILTERQRDYVTVKQDLRNLERENRELFTQGVHLRVDNQFKDQTIQRLERDQNRVTPAATNKPSLLLAAGGTAAAGTAAALWYAQKVSALENRIRTSPILAWQRKISRSSPQEMVQSFVDLCNEKLGPVPPARALAHLKQEIAKCIHLLQKYLSWRPWQDSIVGSFLALDETKFAQCETYLESLKAIQDAITKPKGAV